ncbi:MAG TPA: hypothetical protein VG963_02045 [Polyangiaceae bacterium]|nr:hypothetical protein [Polyangiaceae bacterium]
MLGDQAAWGSSDPLPIDEDTKESSYNRGSLRKVSRHERLDVGPWNDVPHALVGANQHSSDPQLAPP